MCDPGPFIMRTLDLSTLAGISQVRGQIGHQFVLFVQCMIASGVTGKMLDKLGTVLAPASPLAHTISCQHARARRVWRAQAASRGR